MKNYIDWENCGLDNFKKLCKKRKITFEITHNYIKYKTTVDAWLIEFTSSGKLTLWHLNKFNNKGCNDNFKNNDYHLQKTYLITDNVLSDIFIYTFYHDKNTIKDIGKPTNYDKKMEKLFAKISVNNI